MILLENRADVFARSPVLAHAIRAHQEAFAPQPGDDPEDRAWFDSFRDGEVPYQPKAFRFAGMLVLESGHTDAGVFAAWLPEAWGRVMDSLGWERLSFLLLGRGATWLSGRDDFPPLSAAFAALRRAGVDEEFRGAITVDRASLYEVLPALFWLTRCDPDRPVSFGAEGAAFRCELCQYGNLHVELYDKGLRDALREAAGRAGFVEGEGMCDERFSADGRIEGRRIELD